MYRCESQPDSLIQNKTSVNEDSEVTMYTCETSVLHPGVLMQRKSAQDEDTEEIMNICKRNEQKQGVSFQTEFTQNECAGMTVSICESIEHDAEQLDIEVHQFQTNEHSDKTMNTCEKSVCRSETLIQNRSESQDKDIKRRNLVYHKRKHIAEKPFKCDYCDYSTKWPSIPSRHKARHTGENPYKCELCVFSTHLKRYLMRHRKTHIKDKEMKK